MKRTLPFAIIICVLAIALLTTWYFKRSKDIPPQTSSSASRTGLIKLGADPPHALGSTDAEVMIEEFGDFECASCAVAHPALKTAKGEFGPKLVIVFREFPLASKHPRAIDAARAAEAAGLQGKFWEMHDLLYQNQKAWHEAGDAQPFFEEYAMRIGLALDRFRRDLSSAAVDQRIFLDRERGYSIGVNSTPTVFMNGREVPLESLASDKLRDLIRAQIVQ